MCQCGLHAVLWSHIGTLPRCITSQYHRIFIILSVSLWNDLGDPGFDCVVLTGFKSLANASYWLSCLLYFCLFLFPFFYFHSMGWYCGGDIFGLIGC